MSAPPLRIPFYQVDAFTSRLFGGNPAGVCLLESWLPAEVMQAVAAENNLSETAFLVKEGDGWGLRWFTPEVEVDLCGHATLASGFVLLKVLREAAGTVRFSTQSGPLAVNEEGNLLSMDFPSRPGEPCQAPPRLLEGLGIAAAEVRRSRDYLVVVETEEQVRSLRPDMGRLAGLEALGVIVTAPGRTCDFVSRFFAPDAGVPEDPVTGSAHCTLVPYWSHRLGKKRLHALQVSARGGELFCEDRGGRVSIAGTAALYLRGHILV
ncbi:MAG: PhzF family phenazine biosynthesis protein [Acidobacteriota bacterium]